MLGGGSGGRSYADGNDAIHIVPDLRNQPAEFTETRFPLLVEKLAFRTIPAVSASAAAGWATRSTIAPRRLPHHRHRRRWGTAATASTAARPGKPFCVTVDVEATPRDLGGLVDGEPVLKGQVVRVVTTGGGGWGDPLEREGELVLRDVIDGKVSLKAVAQRTTAWCWIGSDDDCTLDGGRDRDAAGRDEGAAHRTASR